MTISAPFFRMVGLTSALALLAACSSGKLDWDLRSGSGLNTSEAARNASANRPTPDARGVLSYPGYQVALARRGDTVASVSARIGLDAAEVARYNSLQPQDPLRDGEVIALPRRVAETAPAAATGGTGAIIGAPVQTSGINVTSIASSAIDKASAPGTAPASAGTTQPAGWQKGPESASTAPGTEPIRHQVKRGETAYTISRAYNVTPSALAEWNGLDAKMMVREGQYLMIPVPAAQTAPKAPAAQVAVPAPGQGSPTPVPPSAAKPLPAKDETAPKPAAGTAQPAAAPVADLGATRTTASSARLAMPVSGQIIRPYEKKKNEGIDISAAAGTAVAAAADGTVAAITKTTEGVPILVIRHADNLLTVYGGIDAVSVAKGASVKRGQAIAKVRAGTPSFLHFEVRKGFDSVDPMTYLQ